MPVLSDKWIKKNAKLKGMIKPFVINKLEKVKFLLGCLRMDMMPEFLMSSRFLQM